MEDMIKFDYNWLSLPKNDFRVLVMILDLDGNLGNKSDMCRYLDVSAISQNKTRIINGLKSLENQGIIIIKKSKRKYLATIQNPIEKEIAVKREYIKTIMKHEYESSVAWPQVLKCYLWLLPLSAETIFTRKTAADILKTSVSTVGSSLEALIEYDALTKEKIVEKISENEYRTLGLKTEINSWWNKK